MSTASAAIATRPSAPSPPPASRPLPRPSGSGSGGQPQVHRPAPANAASPTSSRGFTFFGGDGPTFDDLLDVINPLQHLPIISIIYRELTGDRIGAVPELAGGFLFGGIPGVIAAGIDVLVAAVTDMNIGDHVVDLVKSAFGDDEAATVAQAAGAAETAGRQAVAHPSALSRLKVPPLAKRFDLAVAAAQSKARTEAGGAEAAAATLDHRRASHIYPGIGAPPRGVVNLQVQQYERGAQVARGAAAPRVDIRG